MSVNGINTNANFPSDLQFSDSLRTELAKSAGIDNVKLQGMSDGELLTSVLEKKGYSTSVPTIDSPKVRADSSNINKNLYSSVDTSGASILVLIQQTIAEQARQNRDTTYQEQMNIAEGIENQSKEMLEAAKDKRTAGIITGITTITSGAINIVGSGINMGANKSNAGMLKVGSDITSGASSIASGIGQIVSNEFTFQAGVHEANEKAMEAQNARLQASVDQLKAINDSLLTTMQKSIDTLNALQQNMNETTKRILV